MRTLKMTAVAALILLFAPAFAQKTASAVSVPEGSVMYCLPSTTLNIMVEAECETFTAGPYARYAQKYFGIDARQEDATTYTLTAIQLVPYLEADYDTRRVLNVKSGKVSENFFRMTTQGLVVMSDSYTGKPESWRFPTLANDNAFTGKGIDRNLTETSSTLYRTVRTEAGFEKVPVQQKQVVEKSLEMRAAAAAESIFELRRQRQQIITGDTDATFSGEALGAAVAEINRLESEYLSLFIGTSITSVQTMNFDVVPSAENDSQFYIAFRISDTAGLVPANDISGRPIVVELILDGGQDSSDETLRGRKTSDEDIWYRVPAIAQVRVMDGGRMLLQTRVPIYQLGSTLSMPAGKFKLL